MNANTANRRFVAQALRPGGPEVIEVRSEEVAALARGEALVRVEAAGLNHVETLVRSGTYPVRLGFPYPVGIEGAGTVVAVGPDVSIEPGTRVCWTAVFGSCATLVAASAQLLAPLPDTTSFEAGASLAHAGVTAAGLVRQCPLSDGSHAVVWGAAGAVGRVLVARLIDRGISVVGIASGSRVDAVRRLGAEHVVDRTTDNVVEAVREYTRGRGAHAVFDPVGAATYETNLQLLAPRGYLVNYGQLSGALPTIDLGRLMEAGSIFVTKYGPRAGLVAADRVAAFISETLALAATRPVASDIVARFPLDRVVDAYRLLEASPQGKVLVRPQQCDGHRSSVLS
ncbi:MAG: zinc-binding dehydrogenase [Vicinamibacterales bacterium]